MRMKRVTSLSPVSTKETTNSSRWKHQMWVEPWGDRNKHISITFSTFSPAVWGSFVSFMLRPLLLQLFNGTNWRISTTHCLSWWELMKTLIQFAFSFVGFVEIWLKYVLPGNLTVKASDVFIRMMIKTAKLDASCRRNNLSLSCKFQNLRIWTDLYFRGS